MPPLTVIFNEQIIDRDSLLSYYIIMKIISTLIILFAFTKLSFADTYEFEGSGKVISNDSIELKKGFEKSIIVNESTWTDSNGDYGIILCLGTIDKFLDKSVVLNLGCSGRNQDGEKFTGNIV
jgi:hypothetical protein